MVQIEDRGSKQSLLIPQMIHALEHQARQFRPCTVRDLMNQGGVNILCRTQLMSTGYVRGGNTWVRRPRGTRLGRTRTRAGFSSRTPGFAA